MSQFISHRDPGFFPEAEIFDPGRWTPARRWRTRLVRGHPVELLPVIILRPKHGMRMKIERR